MGDKISNELLEQGFFSALGTMENAYYALRGNIVKRGKPCTWDYNNGVMVVYDEEGRPWIKHGGSRPYWEDRLTRGDYVPHSNDGGLFVCEILPKL